MVRRGATLVAEQRGLSTSVSSTWCTVAMKAGSRPAPNRGSLGSRTLALLTGRGKRNHASPEKQRAKSPPLAQSEFCGWDPVPQLPTTCPPPPPLTEGHPPGADSIVLP